jgi:DNA-binding NtrC family response regulator
VPGFRLLVLSGPSAGCEFPVDGSVDIGRSRKCAVTVTDVSLSRQHFQIEVHEDEASLVDLGSSNGTFLDGRKVNRADIRPGAIITAGNCEFTVVEDHRLDSDLSVGPAPATTAIIGTDAVAKLFGSAGDHRDLVILYSTARRLPACETLSSLGRALLQPLLQSLKAKEAMLFLCQDNSRFQEVARVCASDDAHLPLPSRSLLSSVVQEEKGILAVEGNQTTMAFPLPSRGECVALAWLGIEGEASWDDRDLCLAVALGEIAGPAVANLLARLRINSERRRLKRTLRETAGIIGESEEVKAVVDLVSKLANTESPVLVLGETGSGKELIARALHYGGSRAGGPLVSINCAALASDIAESELFGHEKGAFTGASSRRRGRFELASSGTLFLDEVGELSLDLQAKLLRVLETGKFERVGGEKPIEVDVRLVAATNRNLEEEVQNGRFRKDLLFRLKVVPVSLPPLRDRKGDVPLLIDHFLIETARTAGLAQRPTMTDEAVERLCVYRWPGNVRELRNVIEQCVVLCEDNEIRLADLPDRLRLPEKKAAANADDWSPDSSLTLRELEAIHIKRVLDETQGNKKKTAQLLGIERATLYAKLKKYGIS